MNLEPRRFRALIAAAAAGCLIIGAAPAAIAQPPEQAGPFGQESIPEGLPQLESLDRGLVAVSTSEGVFLSWRLLASEVTGASETGLTGPAFVVSRDGVPIATVTDSTNLADPDGDAGSTYTVTPVVDGIEGEASAAVTPSATGYLSVPLSKPADGVTPDGRGVHLLRQRHERRRRGRRRRSTSSSSSGTRPTPRTSRRSATPATVFLDTYEFDGTLLNRIDLGVNIRAGAHYTQFLVYDFDGDGRTETDAQDRAGHEVHRPTQRTVPSRPSVTSRCRSEDVAAGVHAPPTTTG